MKLLIENWRKYNDNPFELMCEQYDKNLLTEEKLAEYWQETTLRELEQLNEIDWEKEAELTADPDYKPPQERRSEFMQKGWEFMQKGWEKVNDWILMKSIQIYDLAKRSATAAIKSIAWLVRKVSDLCKEYKTICKIAIMTLTVIAFYAAMAYLFENEAQAKLYRRGKPLSDNVVNAMKGELYDIIEHRRERGGDESGLIKLMAQIDELHQAKTKHDFIKVKTKVDQGLELLYDSLGDAVQGTGRWKDLPREERVQLTKRWMDIGSRVKAWYRETTKTWDPQVIDVGGTKVPIGGGKDVTADWGMTLAKKIGDKGAAAGEEVSKTYFKLRKQRN